jgi:hypothetical protein
MVRAPFWRRSHAGWLSARLQTISHMRSLRAALTSTSCSEKKESHNISTGLFSRNLDWRITNKSSELCPIPGRVTRGRMIFPGGCQDGISRWAPPCQDGTWSIPQIEPLAHTQLPPEAEEWDRPAHDLASFLVEASRQVVSISGRTPEPWRALATVAENYRTFLSTHVLIDDPNGRSAFRTAWCC